MDGYAQVCEEEGEEPMEMPLESDGTLSLATLAAQFPGVCGLKYRHPDTNALRGVRISGERFLPPDEGWDYVFICSFPKDNKRKIEHVDTSISKRRMQNRKCVDLIVLGLPWKTTEDEMREYFEKFGELKMVQVKKDANTGRSRGFGFIRFSTYEGQRRAMLHQKHVIDGRILNVRVSNAREEVVPPHNGKVFVGRLTEKISSDDLQEHFSKYGEIVDLFYPKPFRGFAFITFLDPEVVEDLRYENHVVQGVSLNVTPALPRNDDFGSNQGRGGAGFGGGYSESGSYDREYGRGGDSRGSSRPYEGNWNSGGNACDFGGANGGGNWFGGKDVSSRMDWSKMAANMNPLAMPMLAALSQASMEIMESMNQGGGPPSDRFANRIGPQEGGASGSWNLAGDKWEGRGGGRDRDNRSDRDSRGGSRESRSDRRSDRFNR